MNTHATSTITGVTNAPLKETADCPAMPTANSSDAELPIPREAWVQAAIKEIRRLRCEVVYWRFAGAAVLLLLLLPTGIVFALLSREVLNSNSQWPQIAGAVAICSLWTVCILTGLWLIGSRYSRS
jgi:hypothetical protein